MAQTYALKYLTQAALSAPKDMLNAYMARYKAIHPTVLIFQCTFVCDARCEMCSNWQRGDRKTDMTLEQIERAFKSPLWKNVEMAMLSGGEPTTRNDMVEVSKAIIDNLPKLRKYGINTTGLTPHRAIPMITKVAEYCAEKGVIFSTRVSIDGVGEMHNEVRHVKGAFEKANKTITAMKELQKRVPFNFGVSATIFNRNIDDCENILAWARREGLDIVFNMVRFSESMLGNAELAAGTVKPIGRDEERLRQFFLERVRMDPLMDGQNYIHMHYADMIGNGYHREAPCPFQTQGIMLNPDGGLYFCENSEILGNVTTDDPEEVYFRATSQKHRDWVRDTQCPTCLSPCQMNVAAVKQVVPYVKFLFRATREKRRPTPARIPATAGSVSE